VDSLKVNCCYSRLKKFFLIFRAERPAKKKGGWEAVEGEAMETRYHYISTKITTLPPTPPAFTVFLALHRVTPG
jgi:hypothetical protein